jgi:hypothetical protein
LIQAIMLRVQLAEKLGISKDSIVAGPLLCAPSRRLRSGGRGSRTGISFFWAMFRIEPLGRRSISVSSKPQIIRHGCVRNHRTAVARTAREERTK